LDFRHDVLIVRQSNALRAQMKLPANRTAE
jgi:hypothetical protein